MIFFCLSRWTVVSLLQYKGNFVDVRNRYLDSKLKSYSLSNFIFVHNILIYRPKLKEIQKYIVSIKRIVSCVINFAGIMFRFLDSNIVVSISFFLSRYLIQNLLTAWPSIFYHLVLLGYLVQPSCLYIQLSKNKIEWQ